MSNIQEERLKLIDEIFDLFDSENTDSKNGNNIPWLNDVLIVNFGQRKMRAVII